MEIHNSNSVRLCVTYVCLYRVLLCVFAYCLNAKTLTQMKVLMEKYNSEFI